MQNKTVENEHSRIAWTPEERAWKQSLKISDWEFSKIFPEAKKIWKEHIKVNKLALDFYLKHNRKVKNHIYGSSYNLKIKNLWIDIQDIFYDLNCKEHEDNIKKLERNLSYFDKKKPNSKTITDVDIAKAKAFLIEDLLEFDNSNSARCIFHNEKTASMHLYRDTNTVYCFGCNKKADSIDLAM